MKKFYHRFLIEPLESRQLLAADVVINEFLASNQNGLRDEDQDSSDWIELLNAGDEPIPLVTFALTDDADELTKWPMPDITLDPGEFLLVFASGKDRTSTNSELHTNFKLGANGEFLALVDIATENVVSGYSPEFPPQSGNVSYGLTSDRTNSQYFTTPTPNAPNGELGVPNESANIVINEIMYHPASDLPADEYIELLNAGAEDASLGGWRLSDGARFTFPDYSLPAGESLIVAADVAQFRTTYGDVPNLIGGWNGKLRDSGETIELVTAAGTQIDAVTYSDEGDWARRVRGVLDRNHRGWTWSDAHDGEGRSLELVSSSLDNDIGQNWLASTEVGGTPGRPNSVASANAAPFLRNVSHAPIVPSSIESVTVRVEVTDELPESVSTRLHWRVDGEESYQTLTMNDDGLSGDGLSNDGVYAANIPPQADRTVIEFFVSATDASRQTRHFPNVVLDSLDTPNLLYQVDDSFAEDQSLVANGKLDPQPKFRLVMTEAERAELAAIGAGSNANSNAQMNGTFISVDGRGVEARYNVGIRNRGKGSRNNPPNNYRVNFANDRAWNDVTSINLNTKQVYTQVLGSAFFHRAGVVAANATAVHVRVNGEDLSTRDPSMYGSYNYLQVIDSDFAELHFPNDNDGNIYSGVWISRNQSDLRYEGDDPDAYRDRYFKETNKAEDDWSDLLRLIEVLNNTPLESLLAEFEQVADLDQWLRFFATDTILTNRETSPSNGIGDDYRIHRGEEDPRFIFIPHDMDSILGTTDGRTNYDIWLPSELDGISRLMSLPEVAERYYATFIDLIENVFSSEAANLMIERTLASWVPQQTRKQLLEFIEKRTANILSQIPDQLTVSAALSSRNGLLVASQPTTAVSGFAPAARSSVVRVNGLAAAYDVQAATWSADVELLPGLNRIQVASYNAAGEESAKTDIDIWLDPQNTSILGETIESDLTLTPDRTWNVTSDLIIPEGVTVIVEPGTIITVADGVSIRVEGLLQATGSETQPIRFTRNSTAGRWNGIQYVNTQQANDLSFVDLAYSDGNDESIFVDHARLNMDHVRWHETTGTSLEVVHPTLVVTNSRFPSVVNNETIHGRGLVGDEQFILRDNSFGSTTGYSDIVDFTGGQRPGPILQVIGNTFEGGSDDGLDLDGTDAYIAGNVFRNIHKNNTSSSSSNAIATGVDSGDASEIVVVGNVFYNVDNALLLKERSSAIFENNIVVNASLSAINMDEPNRNVDPGASIEISDSIFWETETILNNVEDDPVFGVPEISINDSLLPEAWHSFGEGNFFGDPGILDLDTFELRSDSPATLADVNENPTPTSSVVINEVYANSVNRDDGTNGDWIELHNPSEVAVNLSSWSLTDNAEDATKFVFPEGSLIEAGGYLLLPSFSKQSDLETELKLSAEGETLHLFRLTGGQRELADEITFGLQISDYSIGRVENGVTWQLNQPTPGSVNVRQRTGIASQLQINEWLARGTNRSDFVELKNNDPLPSDLSSLYLSDTIFSWPDRHEFAPLSFIAPNGFATFIADGDATRDDHLNFRLSANTSQLGLYDRDLSLIDFVQYAPQQTDVSEGLQDDGTYARFDTPTPGAENAKSTRTSVSSKELISIDHTWRFDTSGEDLGTSWKDIDFDDATWNSGPAPFGQATGFIPFPVQTPLELGQTTYYFRTEFDFEGDADVVDLFLQTQIDDGAVFYLNGQEVLRINMGFGEVTNQTQATDHVVHATLGPALPIDLSALRQGVNVLAAEVHQRGATSPDIVFAASLTEATPEFPPIQSTPTGDLNRDGKVDVSDIDDLFSAIAEGSQNANYDVNRDGLVEANDAAILVEEILQTNFGDANLDGSVEFADFLALAANFGNSGNWSSGDFDGDQLVTFADFLLLSANFGRR